MTAPYGRGSETPHLRVTKAAFKSSPRLVEAYLQLRIQIAAMNQLMLEIKPPTKTQYSEHEAAEELGVSVDQLRTLIRSHIVETDEDLNNVSIASFNPSDLLVLKLLNGPKAIPTPQD
jgi:hypothetical protein